MPITQARMLTLISAARDYQQALHRATREVEAARLASLQRRLTPETALENLYLVLTEDLLLRHPGASVAAIEIEETHFKRNGKNNDRERGKAQRRRAREAERTAPPLLSAEGVEPHASSSFYAHPISPPSSRPWMGDDAEGEDEGMLEEGD